MALLRLLRLTVLFEIRTIATVVFAFEQEAAVQGDRGERSEDKQWKKSSENMLHRNQIYKIVAGSGQIGALLLITHRDG